MNRIKLSVFTLTWTLFSISTSYAQKQPECSFKNLSQIAQAMIETPHLGSCEFKNIKTTQDDKNPCAGSMSFEVSNENGEGSTIGINTTLFSDFSVPNAIDPDYMFTLKTLNENPNQLTITEISYTLFTDKTKSIIIRDFSVDPNYKNDVNVVCQNL